MNTRFKPYRDGLIHVLASQCATCIFRPGNLMRLERGRRDQLVRDSVRLDTAIICHSTLDGPQAVCGGFYDRHKTTPLRLAERLGMVKYVEAAGE